MIRFGSRCRTFVALVIGLLEGSAVAAGSRVPARAPDLVGPRLVVVRVGQSVLVRLPRRPGRLTVDDPGIASLEGVSGTMLRITGRRAGDTHVRGRDVARRHIMIGVKVLPGPRPARARPVGGS